MNEGGRVRALAVDDDCESRTTLERLSRYGIQCTAVPPPRADAFQSSILALIEQGEIDVVLLDFRLDDQSRPGDVPASYRGGMLAAAIKEKFATPIVLVTTEEKLREYIVDNPRIRDLFDHTLLKSQIGGGVEDRQRAVREIINLADGFRAIRSTLGEPGRAEPPRAAVCELLGIEAEEVSRLEERLRAPVPTKLVEFATWLLQGLLAYPGPLLDAAETRARLGLTEEAFGREKVRTWAEEARYEGVFGGLRPRWWEGRLLGRLQDVAGDASFGEAEERVNAIAAACGESGLVAARCPWCGGGLVQRPCRRCGEAVDATHHLGARVDARPSWALPAIFCFRCIASGRVEEVGALSYGPGSERVIAELKGLG